MTLPRKRFGTTDYLALLKNAFKPSAAVTPIKPLPTADLTKIPTPEVKSVIPALKQQVNNNILSAFKTPLPKPIPPPASVPPDLAGQVSKGLQDFEVKRGNITSGAVTGTTPSTKPLPLPKEVTLQSDIAARKLAISQGKLDYLTSGGSRVPVSVNPQAQPDFGERLNLITGGLSGSLAQDAEYLLRFRGTAQQSQNAVIRFANTPTALFGLTPGDIAGIAMIGTQSIFALKNLTEFGRLPQVKAMEQYAKAKNIPKESPEFKQAQSTLRTAFNLYKTGAKEAADEIIGRFNQAYAKTFKGVTTPAGVPKASLTSPIVPEGTQTGIVFGGKAMKGNGDAIAKALGITFQGSPSVARGITPKMAFRDPVTQANISGNTLEEVKAELDKARATMPAVKTDGTDLSQAEIDKMVSAKQNVPTPMQPSTSVAPDMFGKPAQSQMLGEVSGKTSQKVPLTQVPQKGTELQGQRPLGITPEEVDQARANADYLNQSLTNDPVANFKFKIGGKNVGLDSLISIKEQSFPEYLTVKQAQALNPGQNFSKFAVKGTKNYNRVPKDAALDELTKEFNMTPDEIAQRVEQIRANKGQLKQFESLAGKGQPPAPPKEPPQVALMNPEPDDFTVKVGDAYYNEAQIDALAGAFTEYLSSPTLENQQALIKLAQSRERARRFTEFDLRSKALQAEGKSFEEAEKQARIETLSGKLTPDQMVQDFTGDMRDVLFAKLQIFFKDKPNEITERISTEEALTNLLATGRLPDKVGTGTDIFPEGGSARLRLERVFGGKTQQPTGIQEPKQAISGILEAIAGQKKPLKDIVEGVFRESGRDPIPSFTEEELDYLRNLPTSGSQQTLGAEIPNEARGTFVYDPSGKLGWKQEPYQPAKRDVSGKIIGGETGNVPNLALGEESFKAFESSFPKQASGDEIKTMFEMDMISNGVPQDVIKTVLDYYDKTNLSMAFDRLGVEMAREPQPITRTQFSTPIDTIFKQAPLLTDMEKSTIVKVLKEIGMSIPDIGNFLRANLTSFDFSAFRTGRKLGTGHPVAFYKSQMVNFAATFSQKIADANWTSISRDPTMELYEKIRMQSGADPLRAPSNIKGISRNRRAEEYGFATNERLIPRLTQKIPWIKFSERGFVSSLNTLTWDVWKSHYDWVIKHNLKVASGEIPASKVIDVVKEMTAWQTYLGDMTQRASLGRFENASAEIGGALFAAKARVANMIVGRNLFSRNPRVNRDAWRSLGLWIGSTAGLILLGEQLGWWDVEKDPRSGQAWVVRIGNTRIDPWEGQRSIVTLYSRLVTGVSRSAVTGQKRAIDAMSTVGDFIRSSLNTLPSLIVDLKTGKTIVGEKTDLKNIEQDIGRVAPMDLFSIWQTFQEDWKLGLATTPLSLLGESVNTYDSSDRVIPSDILKLGRPDQVAKDNALKLAVASGASQSKIADIQNADYTYDMASLARDIQASSSPDRTQGLPPIAVDYWKFNTEKKSYDALSTKEQESYLKDNPNFVIQRTFWGTSAAVPDSLQTAQGVVDLANRYNIPLDLIPAFKLNDKGQERIPADKSLWPVFFNYYDVPGSGGYLSMTQSQVDSGELPDKYLKEWQTYQKLTTDLARSYFRKAHKEASLDMRADLRKKNKAFDQWLQENKDMQPLDIPAPKKVSRATSGSLSIKPLSTGGGVSASPRRSSKKTLPKFKKIRVKTSMKISAPRI